MILEGSIEDYKKYAKAYFFKHYPICTNESYFLVESYWDNDLSIEKNHTKLENILKIYIANSISLGTLIQFINQNKTNNL